MAYNKRGGIDLHIHSTASDGTLSPTEILRLAQHLQLSAISITDHDTTDGSRSALTTGIPESLDFLTGVEISASPPESFACASGSLHILGYAFHLDDPALNQALARLQESRKNRNPRIIERLRSLGYDIDMADVIEEVQDGQVGRPHIARAMVRKKIVKTISEAFDRYLAKDKPAYVDKFRIGCEQAIEIIRGAGGIPVLAHPILIGYDTDQDLEHLIRQLKSMGLRGIEAYYPDHTPAHTAFYTDVARRLDLLITGGTDFHGNLNPEIKMGIGRGDLCISYDLYKAIIKENRESKD